MRFVGAIYKTLTENAKYEADLNILFVGPCPVAKAHEALLSPKQIRQRERGYQSNQDRRSRSADQPKNKARDQDEQRDDPANSYSVSVNSESE